MNKTININLGGSFFHIDENAYQKLKHYLEAVSRSLSDDPEEKKEILNDIEARISELLSEKMFSINQVVEEHQIDEVIVIMGQPEDYADVEETNFATEQKHNIKTVVKKLFRDESNRILGGVCSGLGHYVGIDSIWIRLAFIVLIASGFPVLVYIILWLLIPKAKTTSEKLQMQGEPVNINNIEKKIRENFNNVSNNVKNEDSELSEKISNADIKSETKTYLQKVGENFKDIAVVFLNIIIKILALLLIVCSGSIIIALLGVFVFFGSFFNNSELLDLISENLLPSFFLDSSLPNWLLSSSSFIAIIIPMIALFILGIRLLSPNLKKINTPTRLTFLGIWLLAIGVLGFAKIESNSLSAFQGFTVSKQNILTDQNQTIEILLKDDTNIHYTENLKRKSNSESVTVKGIQKKYSNNVAINIKKSETGNCYVEIIKESQGKRPQIAKENAENIEYKFKTIDNKILFDAYFLSDIKNLQRQEEIRVILYIPENTTIYFQKSSKYFLYDIDNIENILDANMADHHFKMTNKGFHCTDCDIDEEKQEENTKQQTNQI